MYGRIGNRGEHPTITLDAQEFFRLHSGKSVIVRYELQPTEPTEKLTNYFFGYVVKEIQNAMIAEGTHCSKEWAYDFIRENCPLFYIEERVDGKWKRTLKEWEDLDVAEAVEVIAYIQQYCAENLDIIIDDPT